MIWLFSSGLRLTDTIQREVEAAGISNPVFHCLDRTPDCTFLGTGSLLPRWRTGKPARGRYLFYNHFISILIVIHFQRPDLRTLYAFLQSSLVSISQKSHRYGYGGIISSPFVYILIFSDEPNVYISFLCRITCIFLLSLQNQI